MKIKTELSKRMILLSLVKGKSPNGFKMCFASFPLERAKFHPRVDGQHY